MNAASAPRMSIVVGTLNRGEVLGRSIDSLLAQDFPKDRYEVIVVDNGCTDGTEALVRSRMATANNLHYVKEPKLGLSNARNKGMMMVPPAVVSLPFKLAFFVIADGWSLLAGALVRSYAQ